MKVYNEFKRYDIHVAYKCNTYKDKARLRHQNSLILKKYYKIITLTLSNLLYKNEYSFCITDNFTKLNHFPIGPISLISIIISFNI